MPISTPINSQKISIGLSKFQIENLLWYGEHQGS